MTPADIVVRWPSAEEIARAAFAAAKAEGCDAIAMLNGAGAPFDGTRVARLYAVIALAQQYPTAPRADLSRKLGCKKAAHDARAYLRQGKWRTFSLDRLNAVRAACGWSAMTGEEAFAAPMTLCGRHWTEFVALRCDDGMSPAAAPLGGSGAENELPPIQDSTLGGEPFPLCGSPSEKGVGAGDCAEKAPANIQSSAGRAEGRALEGPTDRLLKDSQDTGSRSDGQARSEGCGTPGLSQQVREPAPAVLKGREATLTEDLGGEVAEPVVEPGPSDASMDRDARAKATKGKTCADPQSSTMAAGHSSPAELRVGGAGVAHPRPGAGGGDVSRADVDEIAGAVVEKAVLVDKTAEISGSVAFEVAQPTRPRATPACGKAPANNHTPTQEDETEPVAEIANLVVGDGSGGLSSEKGCGADAGVVGLASAKFQSSDGGGERPAGSAAYVGPCGVGTRLAASTGTVPELEAERAGGVIGHPPPRPNRPVSAKACALRAEEQHDEGIAPLPSAGMLAGVEPGPSDAGMTRRGAQNAGFEARTGGLAKEIKPRAVAPSDGFSALRAAALSGGTVSFRKADPPPEKRGVVLKTAELMGDPTPEQRARMAATLGQAIRTRARW